MFLKNVSTSKRVIYFILNNSHLIMEVGIAFYALYKSRKYPVKQVNFVYLPDEILKNRLVLYKILKLIFSLFCRVTLRKHYIIKTVGSII